MVVRVHVSLSLHYRAQRPRTLELPAFSLLPLLVNARALWAVRAETSHGGKLTPRHGWRCGVCACPSTGHKATHGQHTLRQAGGISHDPHKISLRLLGTQEAETAQRTPERTPLPSHRNGPLLEPLYHRIGHYNVGSC